MKLIVGLGNPGRSYANNRHNVGFMVVDRLAERCGIELSTKKFKGQLGRGRLGGEEVILLQPQTYMNLSGECVAPVAGYFRVPREGVIVVHDEIDIPFGVIRIKRGGGAGGHNGLKSIAQQLGGPDFDRVRVGVGRPDGQWGAGRDRTANHVLSDFTGADAAALPALLDDAADAVTLMIERGVTAAMNTVNRKEASPGGAA